VPKEEMEAYLDEAKRISPDQGDVPYFAPALKMGCGIWSNDTILKNQKAIAVFSTKDILEMLE
jgi:predicted nucleic acid-binding protein